MSKRMSRDSWNSFAQHLGKQTDICARHLNKILSAIKKHFRARTGIALTATRKAKTKTKRSETKPNQHRHRHSSIVRAVEQQWSSGTATSATSAPAAGAHHQLPIRSHYIKIIVGRTESVKLKLNTKKKQKIHCTWRSLFCNLCGSWHSWRGGVAASMTLHEHNY